MDWRWVILSDGAGWFRHCQVTFPAGELPPDDFPIRRLTMIEQQPHPEEMKERKELTEAAQKKFEMARDSRLHSALDLQKMQAKLGADLDQKQAAVQKRGFVNVPKADGLWIDKEDVMFHRRGNLIVGSLSAKVAAEFDEFWKRVDEARAKEEAK